MGYIIDTHILLWWLTEPESIEASAHKLIENPGNILLISAASIWEISIKNRLGRVNVPSNFLQVISSENMSILPIAAEEALLTADLPDIHRDPFDRIIVAQAKQYGFKLITRDRMLFKYPIQCIRG